MIGMEERSRKKNRKQTLQLAQIFVVELKAKRLPDV
jgi:hypothetical protein